MNNRTLVLIPTATYEYHASVDGVNFQGRILLRWSVTNHGLFQFSVGEEPINVVLS